MMNGGFWMLERRRRQPSKGSADLQSAWTVGREGMADGGFWMVDFGCWNADGDSR
jgi:hypothetical protein